LTSVCSQKREEVDEAHVPDEIENEIVCRHRTQNEICQHCFEPNPFRHAFECNERLPGSKKPRCHKHMLVCSLAIVDQTTAEPMSNCQTAKDAKACCHLMLAHMHNPSTFAWWQFIAGRRREREMTKNLLAFRDSPRASSTSAHTASSGFCIPTRVLPRCVCSLVDPSTIMCSTATSPLLLLTARVAKKLSLLNASHSTA